ncbi:hypothetical protein Q6293_29460, partial [Klebsiella pneumoniae]
NPAHLAGSAHYRNVHAVGHKSRLSRTRTSRTRSIMRAAAVLGSLIRAGALIFCEVHYFLTPELNFMIPG